MVVGVETLPRTIELQDDAGRMSLSIIDQRALPEDLRFLRLTASSDVARAIQELAVRGAPAIGIAGAAALTLFVHEEKEETDFDSFVALIKDKADELARTRPTAVNLRWGLDRVCDHALSVHRDTLSLDATARSMFNLVKVMEQEDEAVNRMIGAQGAQVLPAKCRILTHCNAGSLATVFYGTALGIVYTAFEEGKVERVYASETRPVNQGARLTTWELARAGVPVTLICDSMAASVMAAGRVDAILVGADRVCANGDIANKIGTYGLAVLARHHGIPFYVAAPLSSFDLSLASGAEVIIEERDPAEVASCIPNGVEVYNPAFDITPSGLITAIISEKGIHRPDALSDVF